jgi:hypothetical protein
MRIQTDELMFGDDKVTDRNITSAVQDTISKPLNYAGESRHR